MRLRELTDDEAIRIARKSPYRPNVVVLPNYTSAHPNAIIRVDLSQRPPLVERIDTPHPQLEQRD